ncbi:probable splicing factor 3A subunit 1 [Tanacetum coccineum]
MKMMSDLHANHHYAKTNNEGGDGRRGGGGLLYDTIKILKNMTKELRSYFICTDGLAAHDGNDRYDESTRDIQYIRQHRKIVRSWKMHTEVLPDDEVDFIHLFGKETLPAHDLISEDKFLAQHSGPVSVSICIPMNYQFSRVVNVNVQCLSETVGSLKDRIAQAYHVPANKQKLISLKAGDMEDNFSLAHYNVGGDDYMLFLSIEDSVARLSMKSPNGIIT